MKRLLFALLFLVTSSAFANVKISDLPLGSGASVLTNDSFPYVDTASSTTKRLKISDIPNVPSFLASVATLLGRTTNTVTTTFTVPTLTKDYLLNADSTSGPFTVTLPSAALSAGFCIDVKNVGSFTVTVAPPGGQFIDGGSSDALAVLDAKHYCPVGSNWFIY